VKQGDLSSTAEFRFTEQQWQRISEELGPNAHKGREELEQCAADLLWWRKQWSEWNQFSPTEETKRLGKIAKLANTILIELGRAELYGVHFASRVIGGWTSIDDELHDKVDVDYQIAMFESEWESFINILKALRDDCQKQVAERHPHPRAPANVDGIRNGIWAAVADVYTRTTGLEPSAYVGSPGSKNEGIAAGRFVRFLMSAIPGEREPKPEEVRWFVRRRLHEVRWW
jgi:hypothetical protein